MSQIIVTPVPIDRSPMPMPAGVTFPMLFAIHPGGAVPSQPLAITFPNVTEALPGARFDLYYFGADPDRGDGDAGLHGGRPCRRCGRRAMAREKSRVPCDSA